MKIILQLVTSLIIAWITITAIRMWAAKTAINSMTEAAESAAARIKEQKPAVRHSKSPEKSPEPCIRPWSIKTTTGETYAGCGKPPPGGLSDLRNRKLKNASSNADFEQTETLAGDAADNSP